MTLVKGKKVHAVGWSVTPIDLRFEIFDSGHTSVAAPERATQHHAIGRRPAHTSGGNDANLRPHVTHHASVALFLPGRCCHFSCSRGGMTRPVPLFSAGFHPVDWVQLAFR